ncbi:MAG: LytTR family DNA-binding domain-containing protein [Myxococcota bacterium]|nr:LytTR family DNA-binding domain-containing protein [Myxococcota bacterium]
MRVLVVDDEPVARQRLIRLLEQIPDVEVIGEASSAKDALATIARLAPDLVLLDIEMPGVDGLSLAALTDLPPIVFVTAHTTHALAAFEVGAHDYLVKPVDQARLAAALDRVRDRIASGAAEEQATAPEPWRLTVIDGSLRRFVDAREVTCFLAQEKYVSFVVGGRELLVRESLDALEQRLAPLGFLRANRGALVRRSAIEAFDASGGGTLVLTGGESIPVSRRALSAIRQTLGV